jgi:transposase-like protein
MRRRNPDLQTIDVSTWPTVASSEFDTATRNMFEKRQQAVLRYIAGESIRAIEKSIGINRRQLYRWLDRAQAQHADGRLCSAG